MSQVNIQRENAENAVNKQVQIHKDQLDKSCREYRESIKLTLNFLNEKLNKTLGENMNGLATLCDELGLYTKRIENQSLASIHNRPIKQPSKVAQKSSWLLNEEIREFDSIKLNIKDSTKLIIDKLEQIEKVHNKLMRAVLQEECSSGESTEEDIEEELHVHRMKSSVAIEPITEVSEDDDIKDDRKCDAEQNVEDTLVEEEEEAQEAQEEKHNVSVASIKDESVGNLAQSTKPAYMSFVRIIQQQDSVTSDNSNKDLVHFKDLSPEVQRRKAFEDIHRRLVQQMEATDSLEGFLRLMERKPKALLNPKQSVPIKLQTHQEIGVSASTTPRSARSTPTHSISGDPPPVKRRRKISRLPAKTSNTSVKPVDGNLMKKYAGSLWFFHETHKGGGGAGGGVSKARSKITAMKPRPLYSQSTAAAFQSPAIVRPGPPAPTLVKKGSMIGNCSVVSSCTSSTGGGTTNMLVHTPEYITQSNEQKCRQSKQALYRTKLKYYDLLDDVVCKDVQPLKSEYPRRDTIGEEKIIEARKPPESKMPLLLNRIIEEDDNVLKNLVEPPSFKTTFNKATSGIAVQQNIAQQHSQPHHGHAHKKKKIKNVNNLMAYLTDPKHQNFYSMQPSKQDMVVMPVKVVYDNFPTKDNAAKLLGGEACQQEAADALTVVRRKVCVKLKPNNNNPTTTFPGQPFQSDSITESSGGDGEKPAFVNDRYIDEAEEKEEGRGTATAAPHFMGVTAVVASKKKAMLDQLHNLKAKNDNIQRNIQKAIDVVETKMIDILSTDSPNNSDAFTAMEQEITKVLNLMKQENSRITGEGQVEKIEAEKDENSVRFGANKAKVAAVSPKKKTEGLRFAGILDHFVPGSDLEGVPLSKSQPQSPSRDKPKEVSSRRPAPATTPTKTSHNSELHKKEPSPRTHNKKISHISPTTPHVRCPSPKSKKHTSSNQVSTPIQFEKGSIQKTPSNMEDSDKLFGQVDNVIKKIDNIYHKFSEKTSTSKRPSSYNNVMEFFDNIKAIDIQTWTELYPCRQKAHLAFKHHVAHCYEQAFIYHEPTVMLIPNEKGDFVGGAIASRNEELAAATEWIKSRQTVVQRDNSQQNLLFDCETVLGRHVYVLQTFYAIFFSTILVALNFDYSC